MEALGATVVMALVIISSKESEIKRLTERVKKLEAQNQAFMRQAQRQVRELLETVVTSPEQRHFLEQEMNKF